MVTPDLLEYIRQCIRSGVEKDAMQTALLAAGWSEIDILQAFSQFGRSTASGMTAQQPMVLRKTHRAPILIILSCILIIGIGTAAYIYKNVLIGLFVGTNARDVVSVELPKTETSKSTATTTDKEIVTMGRICDKYHPESFINTKCEREQLVSGNAFYATSTIPTTLYLWKVTSATGTVYLMGSIHLASKDMYPLDTAIEQAFERSSTLVLEADVAAPGATASAAGEWTYPKDDSLANHISTTTLAELRKHLKTAGIPEQTIMHIKPEVVGEVLSLLEFQRLGFDGSLGIDLHFDTEAKKLNKKQKFLETVEFQAKLFSDLRDSEQDEMLRASLHDLEYQAETFNVMIIAWYLGDTELMGEFFTTGDDDALGKEVYDRLLTKRNVNMTKQIEEYLSHADTHFVVVGAGHLTGSDSIITMLGQSPLPYRIEQVHASQELPSK